jgi:hypothetical protein
MRVRTNLSSVVASVGKSKAVPSKKAQVGRVYGVVTTENTPTAAMFKKAGGFNGIGSVFYLDYNQAKDTAGNAGNEFLDRCKIAKPLSSQFQYFPILGELVYLEDLPSPTSQVTNNNTQKYYISVVNLWNNNQQNSQPASDQSALGLTFVENPNIKTLLSFEGDHIIQGRQGAALRFGSTTKLFSNLNEWSELGKDDDPITIISNGFSYEEGEKFHVEKINKDLSSIYLSSAQKIPLQPDRIGSVNPLTNPIDSSKYSYAQVIINSDRVTLNSKKDEVMIFAKTNVEISTKNIINLNANERIHLNGGTIFLGTVNNQLPSEPLVLGNKTYDLLLDLLGGLYEFGTSLSTVIGSPEGAPAIDINTAAEGLLNTLDRATDRLEGILSQQNYTA